MFRSLEVLVEECEHAVPRQLDLLLVVLRETLRRLAGLKVGVGLRQVVHEGVAHARVREHLGVGATRRLEVLRQLRRRRRVREAGQGVLGAEVRLDGLGDRLRLADARVGGAVEGRRAVDVVRVLGADEGERAAHAEPDGAHLGRPRGLQVLGRLADLPLGGGPVQGAHQVVRLLRVDAQLALVQVRHQAPVPLAGDELRLLLDILVDAPPLLQHDHARRGLVPALVPRDGFAEGHFLHFC
mmetsp:Transcript_9882/g.24391  ORF Transcript_9882/g.24391 Transcript_9882/m.24391 type:complete len:241 (+) Transcript_9882:171-893(+)